MSDREPHNRLVWRVLAEHLEQADREYLRFEDALDSPLYTLQEVTRGPEARWHAHLEGLEIGGTEAFDVLLKPLLDEPDGEDPGPLVSAGVLALRTGRWQALAPALWEGDDAARAAIERAFALSEEPRLDRWIQDCFAPPLRRAHRITLMELAAARGVALDPLLLPLQSDDEKEVVAALRAARFADRTKHLGVVEYLLNTGSPSVRAAAVPVGLQWGSPAAWNGCRHLAASEATCSPQVLLGIALLGGPDDHGYIVQALGWPEHAEAAIYALGWTGNVAAVQYLLRLCSDANPRKRRLSAEAIATLTGVDLEPLEASHELAPLGDDPDEDSPIESDPQVEALPDIDPTALAQWWLGAEKSYASTRRLLLGQEDIFAARHQILQRGTMRQRAPVAFDLTVRSAGVAALDARGATSVQQAQQRALGEIPRTQFGAVFAIW